MRVRGVGGPGVGWGGRGLTVVQADTPRQLRFPARHQNGTGSVTILPQVAERIVRSIVAALTVSPALVAPPA